MSLENNDEDADSNSISKSTLNKKNPQLNQSFNSSNVSKDNMKNSFLSNNNEIQDNEENEEYKEKIGIIGEDECEIITDYKKKEDLTFKLIIIGDPFVGKSSLLIKAIKKQFESSYNPTLGFDYFMIHVKIKNKILKLQIWDTCGQEIYQSLVSNFYRNSSLAFMVYAINDKKSFEHINNWLKEIKYNSNPDIKIFLIGNKSDLENERIISKLEGENLCKKFGFEYFIETSAKTGLNAKEIFIKCAMVLYKDFLNYYKSGRNFSMSSKSTYIYSKNKSATNDTSILKKNINGKKRGKKSNNCC
jgi:small GTP-binding protein